MTAKNADAAKDGDELALEVMDVVGSLPGSGPVHGVAMTGIRRYL